MDTEFSLTEQLQRFSGGDREVADAVLRAIFPELHRIAVRELGRERAIVPLDATELIDEVWLRSLRNGGWQINSRTHFYAIAALAMRRVLVDFARKRLASRRGNGEVPISLDEGSISCATPSDTETIVEMGLLMERLLQRDAEAACVVDLHYFVGYTLEEITEKTGWTLRQVRDRWVRGRDWLKDSL